MECDKIVIKKRILKLCQEVLMKQEIIKSELEVNDNKIKVITIRLGQKKAFMYANHVEDFEVIK